MQFVIDDVILSFRYDRLIHFNVLRCYCSMKSQQNFVFLLLPLRICCVCHMRTCWMRWISASYSAQRSAWRRNIHDPIGLVFVGWKDGGEQTDFNWHIEHKQRQHRKTWANNGHYATVRTFASIDITHIWEWFFAFVMNDVPFYLSFADFPLLMPVTQNKNGAHFIIVLCLTDILNCHRNHCPR